MPQTRIGVDENGLGARLGPLVVTGVMAAVEPGHDRRVASALRQIPSELLADSKRVVRHGEVRLGEAWARVMAPTAKTPDQVFMQLSLKPRHWLEELCPEHASSQCWSTELERFVAHAELVGRVIDCQKQLRDAGMVLNKALVQVTCPHRLNLARSQGQHRFLVDLHAMERLVLALRACANGPVDAVCGRVGGIREYPRYFGPLGERLHSVVACDDASSVYDFPGIGRVAFVRDADDTDPLVMVASLVGKYVRELLMTRVARFYASELHLGRTPSGYHDPVTERFVAATRLARSKAKIPDSCFERSRTRER